MIKKSLAAICLVFILINIVQAEEKWSFVPRIAVQEKNASFTSSANSDVDIDIDITTAEFGLTLQRGDFYGTLTYDRSLNAGYSFGEGREVNMQRADYALTFGYSIIPEFNAFLGIKDGVSEVTSYNVTTATYRDLVFQDQGAFAGVGFSYNFKKYGIVAGSIAYASMNGRVDIGGTGVSKVITTDGTTKGASYSLGWNWPVRQDQVLSIGVKANRYDFVSDDLEYEQNFDIVYFSLSNYL